MNPQSPQYWSSPARAAPHCEQVSGAGNSGTPPTGAATGSAGTASLIGVGSVMNVPLGHGTDVPAYRKPAVQPLKVWRIRGPAGGRRPGPDAPDAPSQPG